jgi:hypothetical protein
MLGDIRQILDIRPIIENFVHLREASDSDVASACKRVDAKLHARNG